jgi:ComEC/Rec2-related protein
MIRPLTLVAVCYAVGILAGRILEPPPLLCLMVGAGLFGLAAMSARWRLWLVFTLFATLGCAHQGIEFQPISPLDLRRVLPAEPRIATVRGRLLGSPVLRRLPVDDEIKERSTGRLSVSAIKLGDTWQPTSGWLVASVAANLEGRFHDGQQVELTGVITSPPGPKAPGLFDYRTFLENQGVHFLLRLDDVREWTLAPGNRIVGPGFSERFIGWAKTTLARGLPDDEATSLLWAMALGWKAALTDEVAEPFMRSGTLHIFAISGLHIALIAGILVKLAVLVRVPRRWCFLPVMALLWFYIGATGWQSSAVRSGVMMSVVLLGWALNRPPDLLNSLFAAAFLILVWEPLQLFQASFQLSFSVVLSIALFSTALEARFRRWFEPDAFLLRDLRPRWKRARDGGLRWLAKGFAVSGAAWIGSLPLTAHYFHLVTPGSLLANLAIVPVSGVALAGCIASLISGPWMPAVAEVFNHAAWTCMNAMIQTSRTVADLPGAAWFVPSPTGLEMALFSMAVVALGFGRFRPGLLRRLGATAAIALVLCLSARAWIDRDRVRLTILPLNGGHAIHVDANGRASDLLVDTGDAVTADLVLRPFLRNQGVNRLPRLALTHGDVRHVGGAVPIVAAFGIAELDLGPVTFRSTVYRKVVSEIEASACKVVRLGTNALIPGWKVLHPLAGDRFTQADDGAMVLLGTIHGVRWLLVADLGRDGQEALRLRHGAGLKADIVVSGLPSRGEPLNDVLLDLIQPQLIVLVDAELPAGERARPELKERLTRRGVPVLFTRTEGAVTAETSVDGSCELRTMGGGVFNLKPRPAP